MNTLDDYENGTFIEPYSGSWIVRLWKRIRYGLPPLYGYTTVGGVTMTWRIR